MNQNYLLKSTLACFSVLIFLLAEGRNTALNPKLGQLPVTLTENNNDPITIYKNWHLIIETAEHVEISARTVKCTLMGPNQVHLMFFNEGPLPKTVKFNVQIVNTDDQRSFTREITVNADLATLYRPVCADGTPLMNSLKTDLPNDYNPNNIIVNITIL